MKTRIATYTVLALAAAAARTACDDGTSKDSSKPAATKSWSGQELSQKQKEEISKAAGLPPKPTHRLIIASPRDVSAAACFSAAPVVAAPMLSLHGTVLVGLAALPLTSHRSRTSACSLIGER
ncbi:hypothetical protein [Streptomyces sp. NPDC004065]|uniref:hypothetical protein n=1 Tax=Streptomyces sp. NPDC004065 TaxID=3364689 RepID=UPI00384DEF2A